MKRYSVYYILFIDDMLQKYVDKFKVVFPEEEKKSMGNGNVSIEVAEFNNKKVYVCVFRNQIGKTLF